MAYGKLSGMSDDYFRSTACERSGSLEDVQRVLNDIPVMKAGGLKAIDISEPKKLSVSDNEISCSGTATLSDTSERPIDYRFYKKHDKWFVEVELSTLPVERNSARD